MLDAKVCEFSSFPVDFWGKITWDLHNPGTGLKGEIKICRDSPNHYKTPHHPGGGWYPGAIPMTKYHENPGIYVSFDSGQFKTGCEDPSKMTHRKKQLAT